MAENEIDCKAPNFTQLLARNIEHGNVSLAQEAFNRCTTEDAVSQAKEVMSHQPVKPVVPGVGDLAALVQILPSIKENLAADVADQLRKDGYAGNFKFDR